MKRNFALIILASLMWICSTSALSQNTLFPTQQLDLPNLTDSIGDDDYDEPGEPEGEASDVKDFFKTSNCLELNAIPKSIRLDMLDYFEANQSTKSSSLFGDGNVCITYLKDNLMRITTSESSELEIMMLEPEVFGVISTVKLPAKDSRLHVIASPKKAKKYAGKLILPKDLREFILPSASKEQKDDVFRIAAMDMISYHYVDGANAPRIVATHNLREFLAPDDWKKIAPYLRDSVEYQWKGNKFSPIKK